jgi:asparagine synthetase B (glutamine-hydrolysing)
LTENKTSGGWTVDYHANDLLHIFQRSGHYDIKNFKYDFIQIIDNLKRACRRDIIVSLSGGFDSTLLCHLFKERIVGVVSYVDDAAQLRDLQSRMQDIIPRVPWCIFSPQEEVDKKELEAYFDSIDEPCCDVAGLADFLMIRKLAASGVDVEKMCILNGEGADNLFMRHREFFKEHILEKAFFGAHLGLILNKKITYYSIAGKIIDYFKSTKTRFYDDYTEHYSLEDFYSSKISRVYNLYDNSLNVGRTDFYNAVDFMLFCSNQATAKLKTTSDGLNVKYLLPFYDSDMIKLAFSINAKYKTGYRLGKVILRKTFKEVNNIACESGSPWHVNMWRKVSGKDTPPGFRKYYYDKWILRKTKDSVNVCK